MQTSCRRTVKWLLLLSITIFLSIQVGLAQSVYLPYSYQFDQKFDADVYSVKNSLHTSLKPFLIDSTLSPRYNKLMQLSVDSNHTYWVWRLLFNQHLVDVKTKDYTFYGDYLPDLQTGRELKDQKTTSLNTRGYQLGGTVGDKFSFYLSGFENQGQFANYYTTRVKAISFIPGQSYDRSSPSSKTEDWSYATAIISYTPIKQLNITLGEDKTFIGDGYRSLLLSDNAAPYPLLRVTANLGKVQYMAMWSYLESRAATKFDGFGSNRRKWGVFHYLDWNVTNCLSLGAFNAIIAAEADDKGNLHGFDLNYINPVILASSLGSSTPIPDNTFIGGTAKYKLFDKTALYGQFIYDHYSSGLPNSNTNGFQLGIRGADIFKVTNLNYLFEFNTVKPYTYASNQPITSYTQYDEPLGDPLGANFKEWIGIVNYSIGKFDFQGQINYAQYGLDASGQNNGKDVNQPFIPTNATTTNTGQGIATTLYYTEATASYLINAKFNLRLEVGALYRNETNSISNTQTMLFTFGLRSTFRSLYHDF